MMEWITEQTTIGSEKSNSYGYPDILPSSTKKELAPGHRTALKVDNGLSNEVIDARGYWTATSKEELEAAGFTAKYQSVMFPALMIPVLDINGEIPYCIMRPDNPRIVNGKRRKYETPAGSTPKLDICPRTRRNRDDINIPVIVTEGAKKADAADCHFIGYFIISINGVYNWRGKNAKGGITALAEWESIAIKGRVFYLAFDSDADQNQAVSTALRRLAAFLESKGAIVKIVVLPPGENGEKTGLDDYFARGGTVENLHNLSRDLEALTAQKTRKKAETKAAKLKQVNDTGKTQIELCDVDPQKILAGISRALADRNGDNPKIFWGVRGLCEAGKNKKQQTVLQPITPRRLQSILTRVVTFTKTSSEAAIPIVTGVPLEYCEIYLADESLWDNMPPIDRIVTAPFFDRNLELCANAGYHAAEQLYLTLPDGYFLPDTQPTPESITAAKVLLLEVLLGEVAFEDQASRANALALMLLPPIMPYLKEQTPLHLLDAPTQSSGKTYAASICLAPFLEAIIVGDKKNEEESRKTTFAMLLDGAPLIFIDNVKSSLASPEIAAAITTRSMMGRMLGLSKMVEVDTHVVWAATAHNPVLDRDTISRSILIKIDTEVETPEQRVFTHSPLRFIAENRATVQAAIITLIKAWRAIGTPAKSGAKVSRFDEWEATLGGILESIEIEGFLANHAKQADNESPEDVVFRGFVNRWFETHGESTVTVQELLATPGIDEMTDLLGEKSPGRALGKMLQTRKDRVINGYKVTKNGVNSRGVQWRLKELKADKRLDYSQNAT
jgi:hypothetical protein